MAQRPWEGPLHPAAFLALAIVLALALRLPGQTRSLEHDEVYTRVIFASRPSLAILTSYDLPNNHILHTLCVRAAIALFGDSERVVRLPALLAGMLAIPAVYGFARRLAASDAAGAVAAFLLAVSSVHVGFSQQARGYTLLTLLCLLYAWSLRVAVEQWRAGAEPPDREWLPWALAAVAGGLAVLTLPSAALFVGAGALAAAALIPLDLPRPRRLRSRVHLLLSTGAIVGVAILVYLPRLDDLYAHADRFGVPLAISTWPGFAGQVWSGVGPVRWTVPFAVVTAVGAGWLAAARPGPGLYLLGLLVLPLVLSLGLATGGQPRVYAYLLPLICTAVAVAADRVRLRLDARLPAAERIRTVAAVLLLCPLAAGLAAWPGQTPPETGDRDAGRWIAAHTVPGDVVVVPYILDSALGYYSRGATVQRVREAVAGGLHRLWFATHPGVPRFDLPDYMLATNFTTPSAAHADTHRDWRLPASAFREVERFARTAILAPRDSVRAVPFADLSRPDSWRLYEQSAPGAAHWFPVPHPAHSQRTALQVRVGRGHAAVLHSLEGFTPAQDGLVLLAYCKTGSGYASLFERGIEPRALQMALPVSAGASVPIAGDTLFAELYLRPVTAGVDYGVFITAGGSGGAAADLVLGDWALYYLPTGRVAE